MTLNRETCPRCGDQLSRYHATSRRDNETKICSGCGTREALEDSGLVPAWSDKPYWKVAS